MVKNRRKSLGAGLFNREEEILTYYQCGDPDKDPEWVIFLSDDNASYIRVPFHTWFDARNLAAVLLEQSSQDVSSRVFSFIG